METRAAQQKRKKDAFDHVMGTVLHFAADSAMMKAMKDLEYGKIDDIATMTREEVMELEYQESGTTLKVPMKSKKKLLHVLWWRDHEASMRASRLVTADDWLQLTEEVFQEFRDTQAANIARAGTGSSSGTSVPTGGTTLSSGTVTGSQVYDFRCSHKCDPSVYQSFNGDR